MATDDPAVPWRQFDADAVAEPVVRELPYLELKLEHPALDPTAHAEQFYPDAVPYQLDDEHRVFYWRPALASATPDPADWEGACATTHELAGVATLPTGSPALTTDGPDGTRVVVDGTVAGETTVATVGSYSVPAVRIGDVSGPAVDLSVDDAAYAVGRGERRRVELPPQRVTLSDENGSTERVTPVLVARYPGRRTVHHPAPGATYRLFPSFGLDVGEIPNPLSVPTTAGELDDGALAERLGVDRSERPYAERVLWQAFAYNAFDPHADATPELAQRSDGQFLLRTNES